MTAAERDPLTLPMGLRERVMAASLLARGPGWPVPAVPEISGAEAFGRAAAAFYALLCALSERDWARPALRGLDVQGLVGHLIGVEDDVQRALAGDPAVAEANHVESTQPQAVRQTGRSPVLTREDWRRAADRTMELAGAAEPAEAAEAAEGCAAMLMHGIRLPLDEMLVVRAFELWVHDNDIRRAAGLPPSVPDPPVLRLMSGLAARMLPGPTRSGSAGWRATGPPRPISTCTSAGIPAVPPACWRRRRRWPWTDVSHRAAVWVIVPGCRPITRRSARRTSPGTAGTPPCSTCSGSSTASAPTSSSS